jgi:hypothetical protein
MAAKGSFRALLFFSFALVASSVFAQQTGSISGRVTSTDGQALPGVTIEAKSNVLPTPRTTISEANGDYRLPQLQPGVYSVTYGLAGLQTVTRNVTVILDQNATVDVSLGMGVAEESITVTAEATLVDRQSAAIQTGLSTEQIKALPITQDYRDLQKFIPGVMVTQEVTRGASGGGSGQDNVYLFDGVNVTMPLFGVQVADPATHDIAQFTVLKGGARAVDFERAGGFSVDSVSKSGTNKLTGEVSYQSRSHNFVADQKGNSSTRFDQDRDWLTLSAGGPILTDKVFLYGSYYRPQFSRENQANNYGELPDYTLDRDEYFGKLTATPTAAWLMNASYRNSKKTESGDQYTSSQAGTTGFGSHTELKIATFETSWVPSANMYGTLKLTDFRNPGGGSPDNFSSVVPSFTPGSSHLDLNALDQSGLLTVPTVIATNPTQAAFVQQFINRYGYGPTGARVGGGLVGFARYSADDDSFYRKNGQIGFNYTMGGNITHDLHFGYQRYVDEEDRFQTSNGWGSITIPGGTVNCPASACGTIKPAFFQAILPQQSAASVPTIHSEFHVQNIEINDTMRLANWTINIGLLASQDTLYGQGLKKADNLAGFTTSPGTKYKMHTTPFEKMLQPRLSATWAYNGTDTVFASFARYNPSANSDARAASWDRNLVADINAYFDENGVLMGIDPVRSSSGKLFVAGIDPRVTNEFMVGSAQQLASNWSARAYLRYRKAYNFWEDTNNNARQRFGAGVPGVDPALYVNDLAARLAAIGSGSTYVIAELDGAFTKHYEASLESSWHGRNLSINGSYSWSHYYGNFDQDNSSFNTANDAAIFIGSSNIGDGAGRQLWNNKYGDLRGDRRNVFKLYGSYTLPWHATAGAFGFYQSGQPYQLESFIPYAALTTSTSDTNRYAEPAGRRRSPAHHQLDLNYTQNFGLPYGLNFQLKFDVFNVYDKQTGYNYETRVGTLGTCTPSATTQCAFATGLDGPLAFLRRAPFAKSNYDPRQFQIAAVLQF